MNLDDLARELSQPWRQQALCRGTNPELFFPERGASDRPIRSICRCCPVSEQCLNAGMGEKFGYWGGLSERERRQRRRRLSADERASVGLGPYVNRRYQETA